MKFIDRSTTQFDLNSIEGFEEVYKKYASRLYGLCISSTKNSQISEDIVQEVFRKVWEKRTQIDTSHSLENFLVKLTKHAIIDHFRKNATEKRKKETFQTQDNYETTPEDLVIYKERKNQALNILRNFPIKTKEIFLMSRKHGLTNRQIALSLTISEKTVEYHISKAINTLRNQLLRNN